jgi:hypothetical protein
LLHFKGKLHAVKPISWLALIGILMPLGILAELYLGMSPIFVLIGAVSMTTSVVWMGIAFFNLKTV